MNLKQDRYSNLVFQIQYIVIKSFLLNIVTVGVKNLDHNINKRKDVLFSFALVLTIYTLLTFKMITKTNYHIVMPYARFVNTYQYTYLFYIRSSLDIRINIPNITVILLELNRINTHIKMHTQRSK